MGRRKNTKLPLTEKVSKILSFVISKKAKDPVVLDMKGKSYFCDYFVICSGTSERHTRAIYEEAIKLSKKSRLKIHHCEDDHLSRWLLIDYFDVVLHIFNEEARKFYKIERLWKEAERLTPYQLKIY